MEVEASSSVGRGQCGEGGRVTASNRMARDPLRPSMFSSLVLRMRAFSLGGEGLFQSAALWPDGREHGGLAGCEERTVRVSRGGSGGSERARG